ncbi:uncharacterized protein CDV56_102392 [Aspergillus thermomutatus]|uniref:Zn(2)-C6 fungal-type domain-containing protein n=1 Tax=Aspergillus thermomutatus TaxID=41047 RepID=A0A397GV13_ASPTH|nr:uncharacterized protein CDV56_102392 [Aspergillus thermomutatus]RHZ52903.1 hypothetical protein CDV56_102392 [Aspergillus thermomutatus]
MDRPSAPKRPRLSMACNLCRQRKVKCDADYPRCKNCRVRNQDCVTTDPQRPGIPGLREWIDIPERSPGIGVTSGNGVPRPQDERPVVEHVAAAVAVQRDAVSATNDESPVHHPFKTSENIEHGTNRMKVVGGTSSQCLAKSLDVFLKAAHLQPVSGVFQYGMRHSEELDIPLTPSLPPLPTQETRDRYLKAFCTRIYILYPIFDLDELRNAVTQLADSSDGFSHLSRERVPSLVSAYLIMSLGADESSQSVTRDGELYLRAATGLLSHLIVLPYVPAVQALVLFAITYRSRNQEGLGRQAIGMAIRMAYSLGIHRPAKLQQNQATAADRSLYSLIWSACCCLERMMQVDSGLPTAIAAHAPGIGPDFVPQDHHFLKWHYQLSEYQGRISQHIYNHGQLGTRSVQEILRDTAQLDRELLAWANQIPVELRPGNDIFCPADEFHIVAMLSIQYHSAMITLLAASSRLEAEVSRYCAEDPSQHRLRRGESICVASARAIAKLSVEIGDRKADSRVLSGGPFLLASIVLAIYLVKQPGSRLQAMDLQVITVNPHP